MTSETVFSYQKYYFLNFYIQFYVFRTKLKRYKNRLLKTKFEILNHASSIDDDMLLGEGWLGIMWIKPCRLATNIITQMKMKLETSSLINAHKGILWIYPLNPLFA